MLESGRVGWSSSLLLVVLFAFFASAAGFAEPVFVAGPGEPFQIPRDAANAGKRAYTIQDDLGVTVAQGELDPTSDTLSKIPNTLETGYHELRFANSDAIYGLLTAPAWQDAPDPFFCIDAGLSWLVQPDQRQLYINLMKRIGVGTVRERLNWPAINPAPGQFQWEADRNYEKVRAEWAAAGIHLLEVSHNAPSWTGTTTEHSFPQNLPLARAAWIDIMGHWQPAWAGLEAWNEPDWTLFPGDMTADQYVPYVKMLARARAESGHGVQLGGGVFTQFCPDEYLTLCGESGLLDCVQFISFHTYDTPESLAGLVERFHRWLKQYHHEAMPLWITEAGKPWPVHPGRPTAQEDAAGALDIAAKAVEARALGVTRFFPFVLPPYTEGSARYGMMDEKGSPLRSLAAYATGIRLLANTRYCGSLRELPAGVKRARFFADGATALLALYTGNATTQTLVTLPFTPQRAAGIDGRPLALTADRKITVHGGLAYAWLPLAQAQPLLDDSAKEYNNLATPSPEPIVAKARPANFDVVLQPRIEGEQAMANSKGYIVRPDAAAAFPLQVRVNNFAAEARPLKLELAALDGKPLPHTEGSTHTTTVGAGAWTECQWAIDMRGGEWKNGTRTLRVTARDPEGDVADALAFNFIVEKTLPDWLAEYPGARPLELAMPVTPSLAAGGTMETSHTATRWSLHAKFGPGDHWVYPRLTLPAGLAFAQWQGVIFRARLASNGEARLILWEQGGKYGFCNASTFIPADGQWHAACLRFDQLDKLPTQLKPEGGLEINAVTDFSLGFNTRADQNTLEIADFHVIPR